MSTTATTATEAQSTRSQDTGTDKPRVVRLSINLAPSVADILKKMATDQHLSITEAVRRAISLWKLVTDEQSQGNRIVVMEGKGPNARQREIVILD